MSSQSKYKMSGLRKCLKRSAEIDLTERFSSQMAQLCMNDNYSDVIFKIEDQRLPAHRVILAARSDYFRALLFGGLLETTQKEIELQVPLEAFKSLLKYIYSGHMPLAPLDHDNVLDVLGLANQYGFIELENAISDYLRNHLSLQNVCSILDAARLYRLDKLVSVCLKFIDRHAEKVLQDESFKSLSKESLEEILHRDSFFAPEVKIFLAVWGWCKCNPDVDINSAVSLVRLPLMNLEDLLQVVRPSGILEPDLILDAIQEQNTSSQLPFRSAILPEENVAISQYSARCIQGECRSALLDGDVTTYDMEKGYTRHSISENDCIVVQLGTIYLINHLKMLLWDRDVRCYSYYIEVSPNNIHWDRVVDYSAYHCRSWQFIYFKARPVRFIRIVGTYNSNNKIFHVVGLEAMYTSSIPTLVNDIIAPTYNVATVDLSAVVVDGVSRTRNALINGDYKNYDWDSGYTCHQLGSGEILVRLGQPYYVGSLRLLLWDCDDRTYGYYVETSMNLKDWQMAVDKRNEASRSWQSCSFTPRPVVYIKIVGTHNTANEIFHCVHLECPSQEKHLIKKQKLLSNYVEGQNETAATVNAQLEDDTEGAAAAGPISTEDTDNEEDGEVDLRDNDLWNNSDEVNLMDRIEHPSLLDSSSEGKQEEKPSSSLR